MIDFNGRKYYLDKSTGYYRTLMRHGDREYLHRAIYKATYGNLPHGWQVHHIDGDKENNNLSNLAAMPLKEHNRQHVDIARHWGRQNHHHTMRRTTLTCEGCGVEYTARSMTVNRWCSKKCANAYWNARNRGKSAKAD